MCGAGGREAGVAGALVPRACRRHSRDRGPGLTEWRASQGWVGREERRPRSGAWIWSRRQRDWGRRGRCVKEVLGTRGPGGEALQKRGKGQGRWVVPRRTGLQKPQEERLGGGARRGQGGRSGTVHAATGEPGPHVSCRRPRSVGHRETGEIQLPRGDRRR